MPASHAEPDPARPSRAEQDAARPDGAELDAARPDASASSGIGLLIALALVYGFGISPGYYGWGLTSAAVEGELGLSRTALSTAFAAFVLSYSFAGLAVARAQRVLDLRLLVTLGACLACAGYVALSFARGAGGAVVGYGLMAGTGVGLSTIVPCQAFAVHAFPRWRATAIGVILAAGGVVGLLVLRVGEELLPELGWRALWRVAAGISLAVALLSVFALRRATAPAPRTTARGAWRELLGARLAALLLCNVAYAVPYAVVVAHGALHLKDRELAPSVAASALGTLAIVSVLGRVAGGLGDLLPPAALLAGALVLEAAGLLLFVGVDGSFAAHAALVLVSLGFGAGYTGASAVTAKVFGSERFARVSGARYLATGLGASSGAWLAGVDHDAHGSYAATLFGLAVLCSVAAASTTVLRAKRNGPATD